MNIDNGGVLSFRDEGPSKGDMLGPVAEAVLFGKRDGSAAILIESGG